MVPLVTHVWTQAFSFSCAYITITDRAQHVPSVLHTLLTDFDLILLLDKIKSRDDSIEVFDRAASIRRMFFAHVENVLPVLCIGRFAEGEIITADVLLACSHFVDLFKVEILLRFRHCEKARNLNHKINKPVYHFKN